MTEPMTPQDCDLRDFVWMPLDCNRLLTSETWVLGSAEEKVASLTLWMKSWHQVPAGSLPDNDKMLAHMSEAGTKWQKVRDHAMRGWVKCSDGRFYHPVVCEKAREAWANKCAQKARTEAARAAKAARRGGVSDGPQALITTSVTESVTEVATGSNRTDQTRTDQREERTPLSGGSAQRPAAPPPRPPNGSRLPQDWQPDEPGCDGATARTLERFRDYWTAQAGAKGRKSDWQATWRNWCRRDAEERASKPRPPLHQQTQAEQDRRILVAAGALKFDDPPLAPVLPLRIAQ